MTEFIIDNKVIVVTGGAGGIGYAIAEKFLDNGAKVAVLLDINDDKGFKAVESLTSKYGGNKAAYIRCDVRTDLEEVSAKIINEYQTVDVLVNSAGIGTEVDIKNIMNINLKALTELSLKFNEYMSKTNGKQGGAIFNIASIFGLTPLPEASIYAALKYGAVGFSKSIGHMKNYELSGVRVIAICPGFTWTDLMTRPQDESHRKNINKLTKGVLFQDADVVGAAVVEVFKKGVSGSVWVIDNGNLSEFITKDYEVKYQK